MFVVCFQTLHASACPSLPVSQTMDTKRNTRPCQTSAVPLAPACLSLPRTTLAGSIGERCLAREIEPRESPNSSHSVERHKNTSQRKTQVLSAKSRKQVIHFSSNRKYGTISMESVINVCSIDLSKASGKIKKYAATN